MIKITYNPSANIISIIWQQNNSILSTNNYIEFWKLIEKQIDLLKPIFIFFDFELFKYYKIPEITNIFNRITKKVDSNNISFINPKNLLNDKTIGFLITLTE